MDTIYNLNPSNGSYSTTSTSFIHSNPPTTTALEITNIHRKVFISKAHKNIISDILVYQPDNARALIISASYDRTIRFWDLNSGKLLKTISVYHKKYFSFIQIIKIKEKGYLVAVLLNRIIILWDLVTLKKVKVLSNLEYYDITGGVILSYEKYDFSKLYEEADYSASRKYDDDNGKNLSCSKQLSNISTNKKYVDLLLVFSQDNLIKIWDILSGVNLKSYFTDGSISCVLLLPRFIDILENKAEIARKEAEKVNERWSKLHQKKFLSSKFISSKINNASSSSSILSDNDNGLSQHSNGDTLLENRLNMDERDVGTKLSINKKSCLAGNNEPSDILKNNIQADNQKSNNRFKPIMFVTYFERTDKPNRLLNYWDVISGKIFDNLPISLQNVMSLSLYKPKDTYIANIDGSLYNINNLIVICGVGKTGSTGQVEIWDYITKVNIKNITTPGILWDVTNILAKFHDKQQDEEFVGLISTGYSYKLRITNLADNNNKVMIDKQHNSCVNSCAIWSIKQKSNNLANNDKDHSVVSKTQMLICSGHDVYYNINVWEFQSRCLYAYMRAHMCEYASEQTYANII